jgi:hypothetical protein
VDIGALAGRARPVVLAETRTLPVLSTLEALLPDTGLRRGSTLVVRGVGATSLTLGLLAAASSAGSWCALVTMADLGLVAAAEAGLDLSRVALVPDVPPSLWPQTVGALIDAVEIVVASPFPRLRTGEARRLMSRARERGSVLIVVSAASRSEQAWSDGPDLRLTAQTVHWQGQGAGYGLLQRRQVEVVTSGRGAAARPRRALVWLPALPEDSFAGSDFADVEPAGLAGALDDVG